MKFIKELEEIKIDKIQLVRLMEKVKICINIVEIKYVIEV